MVEDVSWRDLGIKRVVPRRGAKKFKYGLMAREVPIFCGLVKQLEPRRAVEIGTWWGLGAERILEMTPGCEVISIDRHDHKAERPPELGEPDPRVHYLVEDSRTVQLPAEWYGATDLVFVDGDHRRDGIVSDTRLALSLVAPGGLVIWHDLLELGSVREIAKGLTSRHQYYVSEYLYRHFPLTVQRIEKTALGIYRRDDVEEPALSASRQADAGSRRSASSVSSRSSSSAGSTPSRHSARAIASRSARDRSDSR